jgi:tetraacyldisaccharide 4'-kinase
MRSPTRIAASLLWSTANHAARAARARGWLRSAKLPARTIGIGNLQAGGAGKTPLTAKIAREAAARGMTVAILTRGYRSRWEDTGGTLAPGDAADPAICGDEPALLHELAPEAWIAVGADRVAGFERLRAQAAARGAKAFDLVLLDDALQHWKITCDRYVVAVTDARAGDAFFRDFDSAVAPEDLLVLTKGERFPKGLDSHPNRVRATYRLGTPDPQARYRLVTAIADPARARSSLEKAGYRIVEASTFPDHHDFTRAEADRLIEESAARGERPLLTGKDWVKWRALGVSASSVTVVEPEIAIIDGQDRWDRALGFQT